MNNQTNRTNLLEICCGSLDDVRAAAAGGADRIELNSCLEADGLSCPPFLLKQARTKTCLPIMCMVRCKAGGFYYTEDELEQMMAEARVLLEAGADGIVFGFLNSDKTVNIPAVQAMTDLVHSYRKLAVFHKAFDAVDDLPKALDQLKEIGIDRILTSGGCPTAAEGIRMIQNLIENSEGKIEILPGGGVRAHNVADFLDLPGCFQVHSSCRTLLPDYPGIEDSPSHPGVDAEDVKKLAGLVHHHRNT